MRIYTVDIVVEAANLKFMTKAYAVRLAEFILGVQNAEPTIVTSVTTEVMDFGKVKLLVKTASCAIVFASWGLVDRPGTIAHEPETRNHENGP